MIRKQCLSAKLPAAKGSFSLPWPTYLNRFKLDKFFLENSLQLQPELEAGGRVEIQAAKYSN